MTDAKDSVWARPWRAAWNSPILLLTTTALIWAGHAVVSRLAVGEIAPMTLTFGRWAVALGPILFAARKTLRADLATLRGHWLYVSAMGALGYHRLQRPVLRRRQPDRGDQPVDHPGGDSRLRAAGGALRLRRHGDRAAGARRLCRPGRRDGDRRARRVVAPRRARLQCRRSHGAGRLPALRWLHAGPARAAARLAARTARRHGARRVRQLGAAVRRRSRGGPFHLADRRGPAAAALRRARPRLRRRSSSTCAASS